MVNCPFSIVIRVALLFFIAVHFTTPANARQGTEYNNNTQAGLLAVQSPEPGAFPGDTRLAYLMPGPGSMLDEERKGPGKPHVENRALAPVTPPGPLAVLYESTGGKDNWVTNTNWLAESILNSKGNFSELEQLYLTTPHLPGQPHVENTALTPVNISDSLALVALYDSTDGDNWTTNTNWLTGPVSSWYGVTVSNGRVW